MRYNLALGGVICFLEQSFRELLYRAAEVYQVLPDAELESSLAL